MILQNHLHTRQRGITAALPQPVHRHVQSLRAAQHGGEGVRHREIVVVVGMEIEVGVGIAFHHLPEVLDALQGIHDAQSVRQHKAPDAAVAEGIHQLIDIEGRILHAVRPVLQVEVHRDTLLAGILHLLTDILDMFFRCLLELLGAVFQRTLCQQVHRLAATVGYPVDALSTIHKPEHFHALQLVDLLCIATDHADCLLLAFRHPSRRHLDTIHVEVVQQHTGYHQFLMRKKRDTAGLFSVAQRRVQNLHEGLDALVLAYLFCCSHSSVLFWFCTRKSMSSSPFIRQCFL